MDVDPGAVKYPRNLVVAFAYDTNGMITTNQGERSQLFHYQPSISRPSRWARFTTRLGLTKGNKAQINDAVTKAYMFLSRNYAPGDHVILAVNLYAEMDTDPQMVAAGMLARHLHGGTLPGGLSKVQFGDVGDIPARRIPIHCVVVYSLDEIQSISVWNDELRSRFPPEIGHIVCYTSLSEGCSSCSTAYESDGSQISREICLSPNAGWHGWRVHSTKQFIYYGAGWLPKWEEYEPVWTQVFNSSPSGTKDLVPLASVGPVGMYHHELRKYQRLLPRDSWRGDMSMLVWKSYRRGGG